MSVFDQIMEGIQDAIDHEQGKKTLITKTVKVPGVTDDDKLVGILDELKEEVE